MYKKIKTAIIKLFIILFGLTPVLTAQATTSALSDKQQSIVLIALLTARGELEPLSAALNQGLDRGLTINEIKEILIQMYAYTGFPRSLNGIITFEQVLNNRLQQGINDPVGPEPKTVRSNNSKYNIGKENLAKLSGIQASNVRTGYAAFVPSIEIFLKEHLFADIFERGVLDFQTRELVTVSALTSLGNVNAQLRSHINLAMHNGLTEAQLHNLIMVVQQNLDEKTAKNAEILLNSVIKQRQSNTQ